MANSKRYERLTDFTPDACDLVVALMGTGRSLTAAAGAMGVPRGTIERWMEQHEEFRDAVSRGKAARVLALETQMLTSGNPAVISACRFALLNAAPEEWRDKQAAGSETSADSPLRQLAKQLMGTAIRPRMPEKIIEHESVTSNTVQPQQDVTVDDDDDEVRIHTVSPEVYCSYGEDAE